MATFGPNVLTGGTASAKTDRGGTTYAAAKAVDGNASSTRWASNDGDVPTWWQYDLGAGITKTARKVGFILNSSEHTADFGILGSNDGTTWTELHRGYGANNTSWQYYTFYNVTAFRYYRIAVYDIYSGSVGSITEIEMYECTDPTGLTDLVFLTGGTITVSADRGGYELAKSYDGTALTRWATPDGVTTGWWKYDLGAGNAKVLTLFDLLAVSSERPHAFTVEGSNDNSSWDTLLSTNGANVATWQTFAVTNTTAYRYYRMSVSTVYAGSVISVSELRLWATPGGGGPPPSGGMPFQAVIVM